MSIYLELAQEVVYPHEKEALVEVAAKRMIILGADVGDTCENIYGCLLPEPPI